MKHVAGLIVLVSALSGAPSVTLGEQSQRTNEQSSAIAAIAEYHDASLPDAWAKLYVRQVAINRVRKHLSDAGREEKLGPQWNAEAPEWQAAESELVDAMVAAGLPAFGDASWFRLAWADTTAKVLSELEAARVLRLYGTEPGKHLAATMDWFVAELVMTRLTFTDRINLGLRGSEAEAKGLEQAAQAKLAVMQFDYGPYPEAELFIWNDPGRKYFRDVSFKMVTEINARLDRAAKEVEAAFRANAAKADPYIEAFKTKSRR